MTLNVIICLYFLFVIQNNNIFIPYTAPKTVSELSICTCAQSACSPNMPVLCSVGMNTR